jgi:hypothetical protein
MSRNLANPKLMFSSANNVNINQPLIPNSQEYMSYKKYVSIHSEDRDFNKFPNSSEFEIELPEDYLNVSSILLNQWTFPANYKTFSRSKENTLFSFKINAPFYSPDEYNYRIYDALFMNQDNNNHFFIEDGFYNPDQMCTELINKLNYTVTELITVYFKEKGWTDTLTTFISNGGYNRFRVVYNSIGFNLWFGNTADGFTITTESKTGLNYTASTLCAKKPLPDSSFWGLYGCLGLPRTNISSVSSSTVSPTNHAIYNYYHNSTNAVKVPRFYYGDVTSGDNGIWLLPDSKLTGCEVHWVEPIQQINLIGDSFFYIELAGQNCIDETIPFNISNFTSTTNKTNGIVNSAFAKIPIPAIPLSQWFDGDSPAYKYYYPPAERIRKLKLKVRYHNGNLVDFEKLNYSLMLEFTLMVPQILRETKVV